MATKRKRKRNRSHQNRRDFGELPVGAPLEAFYFPVGDIGFTSDPRTGRAQRRAGDGRPPVRKLGDARISPIEPGSAADVAAPSYEPLIKRPTI